MKNGAEFLLKFLLDWVCVYLPTWEGEFMFDLDCFFIFIFEKNLVFLLFSNTHWNQVYYHALCLWVSNWLLGLGFEYIFKKLDMISQITIGQKCEKEKPIFREFSSNFKPLPESQPVWTSLHFMVVLIL